LEVEWITGFDDQIEPEPRHSLLEGKGATMSLASLPTNGRVLIQTTLGDIEVELWSRVGTHACTNWNVTELGHRNVRRRVEILSP
jgi:hypothetical protein